MDRPERPRRPRLHALGIAHTRFADAFSHCSFTALTREFCRMMASRGYEVIVYATAGSDIAPAECVECLGRDEFGRFFEPAGGGAERAALRRQGWDLFNRRCEEEIGARAREGDIVIIQYESRQEFAFRLPGVATLDAHFGAPKPKYSVFPSKTWRACMYGQTRGRALLDHVIPPYWNHAVIYHYLDPARFPLREAKENYAAYAGRITAGKGAFEAVRICKSAGIPLKLAGPLDEAVREEFAQTLKTHPGAEYLGVLDAEARTELLGRARCALCPTFHAEPFGLAAIEAMATGTPVIAPDWGAYQETVVHGKTGWLAGYFSDWRASLGRVDRIDPHDCRAWVLANFTTDAVFPYYERLLNRISHIESAGGNPWYEAEPPLDGPVSQRLTDPWT